MFSASSIWEWSTKLIREQEEAEQADNEDRPCFNPGTTVICKSQKAEIEEWDEGEKEYKVSLLKDEVPNKRVSASEITPFVPEPQYQQQFELDKGCDVKSICASSDLSTFAIHVDEKIIVYTEAKITKTLVSIVGSYWGLVMSGDGRIILAPKVNDDDDVYTDVQLYFASSTECTKKLRTIKEFNARCISHNGQLVAVGTCENTVQIFELEGQEVDGYVPLLKKFTFGDWVASVNFSKDCEWFVASSYDLTTRIWSLDRLSQEACTFSFTVCPDTVALSNDGSLLVSAEGDILKVWDISTQTEVCVSL